MGSYQTIAFPPSDGTNLVSPATSAPAAPALAAPAPAVFAPANRPVLKTAVLGVLAVLLTAAVTHHVTVAAFSPTFGVSRGYVAPRHAPPVPSSEDCTSTIANCASLGEGRHLEFYPCVRCCDAYMPSGDKPPGFYTPAPYMSCFANRDDWARRIGKPRK